MTTPRPTSRLLYPPDPEVQMALTRHLADRRSHVDRREPSYAACELMMLELLTESRADLHFANVVRSAFARLREDYDLSDAAVAAWSNCMLSGWQLAHGTLTRLADRFVQAT